MESTTRRVSLELRNHEGPPTGVAYATAGERHEFSGWLGLICALDALLRADGSHAHHTEMEDQDVDHPTHRP